MKIEITSGGKDDPRKVIVTDSGADPVEFDAENLAEAHKLIQQGRKDGWDSVINPPKPEPKKPAKADK